MRHPIVAALLLVTLVGCASGPARTAISAEDIQGLAGTWQGWLVTDRSFDLINLEIRADGSFEVSGRWVRGNGVLAVAGGTLRFDGTGPWRGTLVPEGRVLRLERDDRLYRGTLHRISDSG
jgi:hypothetical protein